MPVVGGPCSNLSSPRPGLASASIMSIMARVRVSMMLQTCRRRARDSGPDPSLRVTRHYVYTPQVVKSNTQARSQARAAQLAVSQAWSPVMSHVASLQNGPLRLPTGWAMEGARTGRPLPGRPRAEPGGQSGSMADCRAVRKPQLPSCGVYDVGHGGPGITSSSNPRPCSSELFFPSRLRFTPSAEECLFRLTRSHSKHPSDLGLVSDLRHAPSPIRSSRHGFGGGSKLCHNSFTPSRPPQESAAAQLSTPYPTTSR